MSSRDQINSLLQSNETSKKGGHPHMSKRRTTGEQIAAIDNRMEQMEARKKQLIARKKEEDRKARNHRLILLGGNIEKILGRKLNDEDIPRIRKFLLDQERRGKYFSRALQDTEARSEPDILETTGEDF